MEAAMSIHYSYIEAPNLFIQHQNGKRYAYRELGENKGTLIYHDRMVSTENSYDLANRIADSNLKIFDHAGLGSLFQYPKEFVEWYNILNLI